MRDAAQLPAVLKGIAPVAFRGLCFRAVNLRYFADLATAQPLFTADGGANGTRYIRPGGPQALYVAQDALTAHRELNQSFYAHAQTDEGAARIRAGEIRPYPTVVLGVHVSTSALLDLTNAIVLAELGITSGNELACPWFAQPDAPTRLIGVAAYDSARFEGLVFPSVRNPGGVCLVLFRQRLLSSSSVTCRDATTGLNAALP